MLQWPVTQEFLTRVLQLIEFLIPHFIAEGKTSLVLGIGCTGGRHRSVTLAEELSGHLSANNHRVFVQHRDVDKDMEA